MKAQATIEPPEIVEQLNAISRDAKDTLKFHAATPQPNSAARTALARKMDSLAQAHLPPERVAKLFIQINKPFDAVPLPLKAKLSAPLCKQWAKFYLSLLIPGPSYDDAPPPAMKRDRDLKNSYRMDYELGQLVGLDKIPDGNAKPRLVFSYPADGDFNFYPNEFPRNIGYAIFNRRPDDPTSDGLLLSRWVSAHGQTTFTPASIDYSGEVAFKIPSKWFVKDEIYRLDLCWENDIAQLQPMMNETQASNPGFYAFDYRNWATEWLGTSEPAASIYFRASRFASCFDKMTQSPGTFDAEKFTFTYSLDEPMDSSEIIGTGKLPPDLTWMDNVASDLHNIIHSPEVAYYLSVPRTGNVSTENANTLLPFEQAHLLDADFIRKTPEKVPELFPIAKGSATPVGNGYVLPGLAKNHAFATQTAIPPRITRKHFERPETLKFTPVKFTVHTKIVAAMRENCQSVQQMLEKRVKERAAFFHAMELRRCKREGKTCPQTLADFEKTERANLPKTLQDLLTKPFAVRKNYGDFAFTGTARPPGSKDLSSSFSVGGTKK